VARDLDGSPWSRETVRAFERTGRFDFLGYLDRREDALLALDAGRADVAITIPAGYAAALTEGRGAKVQVLIDGQNSNTARVLFGYAARVIGSVGARALPGGEGAWDRADPLETRVLYNPELQSVVYAVPGIVAILVGMVAILFAGIGTVREKETGTMEQLLVTPLRPYQIILGKVIPYGVLGLLELGVGIGFGKFWFGIPLEGNLFLVAGAASLYLFCALGIGLFVSTLCSTQLQALFLSWFVSVFMVLLSGLFVPIHQMPEAIRWLTRLNPLRYFMATVREVLLKGAGPADLRWDLAALALLGTLLFTTSVLGFRKRLG
ncbi:MAG: ABC transporter permease, partial [Candidatus Eisenbacteria bacterium]